MMTQIELLNNTGFFVNLAMAVVTLSVAVASTYTAATSIYTRSFLSRFSLAGLSLTSLWLFWEYASLTVAFASDEIVTRLGSLSIPFVFTALIVAVAAMTTALAVKWIHKNASRRFTETGQN